MSLIGSSPSCDPCRSPRSGRSAAARSAGTGRRGRLAARCGRGPITVTPSERGGRRRAAGARPARRRSRRCGPRAPRRRSARRREADLLRVRADLEIERHLAHGGRERRAARRGPRRVQIQQGSTMSTLNTARSPSGGASSSSREHQVAAAVRELLVRAAAERRRVHRQRHGCGQRELAVERGRAHREPAAASNGPAYGSEPGPGSLPSRVKRIVPYADCCDSVTRSAPPSAGRREPRSAARRRCPRSGCRARR